MMAAMLPENLPADLRADLEFAIEAADAAGRRVLALRAANRWQGEMLADVGDQAADGYLQGLIRGARPEDGILSEETADTTARLAKRRVWIVDPLDGTREYSQLREDWAVHVALVVDGSCALGAVALPAQGRVLWGVCSSGVQVGGVVGAGVLARGSTTESTPLRVAVSRSHTPSWMPAFAARMGAVEVRCGSVGAKVALLLLGDADLYAHRKGLKEWDTCAPECVARGSGWSVARLDGTPLRYNSPDPKVDEFLVCRPASLVAVLSGLRDSGALSHREPKA
jgi:3'(2'), 5'-bisphosphate nucleotidase